MQNYGVCPLTGQGGEISRNPVSKFVFSGDLTALPSNQVFNFTEELRDSCQSTKSCERSISSLFAFLQQFLASHVIGITKIIPMDGAIAARRSFHLLLEIMQIDMEENSLMEVHPQRLLWAYSTPATPMLIFSP